MNGSNGMGSGGPGSATDFELTPDDIVIAVMGVTGSGKSTFISHMSEKRPVIGRQLKSCTNTVDIFKCFTSSIGTFYLVDTPGFDDTYKSDTDILMDLAAWLNAAYEKKILLTGIIYLHRVLDVRFGGKAMQNLRMFQSLCGEQSLSRVVLATTFWGVVDPIVATNRETELKTTDEYWGKMIKKGSKVFRHDSDRTSAKWITEYLVQKRTPKNAGVTLDIQRQMVDEGKTLDQTGAGREMDAQLLAMKAEYEQKLSRLRSDLRSAIARKDEEWKAQLEEERRITEAKQKKDEKDRQKLQADHDDLKKRLDDNRGSFDREYGDHDRLVKGLTYELRRMMSANRASEEKQELRNQLQVEKNKLEMLRWKIRQAQACVIM